MQCTTEYLFAISIFFAVGFVYYEVRSGVKAVQNCAPLCFLEGRSFRNLWVSYTALFSLAA